MAIGIVDLERGLSLDCMNPFSRVMQFARVIFLNAFSSVTSLVLLLCGVRFLHV